MTQLSEKAVTALDETRMLILGAEVLIGFNYHATLQPAFERLPAEAQHLIVFGLALMLIALGLLIAPGAFHQITEGGNDSPQLIDFTSTVGSLALLPFALGIGIEIYVAVEAVIAPGPAIAAGIVGTAFALFFWYGLDWIWRQRDKARGIRRRKEQPMAGPTSLANKIRQVLTEARVVLPGAQALLGFQLTAILSDGFGRLPKSSQYVHLASLGLIAMTIVLLMAPAAFHRIVEAGEDSERVHRFSSVMLLAAMVPLAFGIAGDFYVVVDKVLDSPTLAITAAALSLVLYFGLWFGVTLAFRARSQQSARLHVSGAAR